MRKICSIISVFIVLALFFSCNTMKKPYHTKVFEPVYMSLSDIRNGINNEPTKPLKNTGKIYFYNNYILINEINEGIHIIDNINPSNPQNISFISIPGNSDMAVRNNVLYANSYIDLVAFDISNITNPTVLKRIENIFPNLLEINNYSYVDKEKGLLVDFIEKDTVIYIDEYGDGGISVPIRGDIAFDKSNGAAESSNGSMTGKGGSMARFTIYDKYLYSVDRQSLQLFDIQNPRDPKVWSKVNIGWDIETIYPFKNKLFIGSMMGMYIYDVSNSSQPVLLSQFSHTTACDPIVADDNFAYVTLRTGTRCLGNLNQLEVFDIKNITNPILLKTYPMQEPAGLGLDNNILFICDGPAGLKVYDVKDPLNIELIDWKSDIHTFDVIPLGKSLLMIGNDGFYQYDYTNPKDLKLLSKIPIVK